MGLWLREIDSGRATIGYWLIPSARGRKLAMAALAGSGIRWLGLFLRPYVERRRLLVSEAGSTAVRTAIEV